MISERLVAGGCFILGALLYAAGAGHEYPEAYFFPNLLAMVMIGLGVIMVVTADVEAGPEGTEISAVPWEKLWPAFLIFLFYLSFGEELGLFVTSFLVFLAVAAIYSNEIGLMAMFKRCFPIALGFTVFLYTLFVVLLKVQMPEGLLF